MMTMTLMLILTLRTTLRTTLTLIMMMIDPNFSWSVVLDCSGIAPTQTSGNKTAIHLRMEK